MRVFSIFKSLSGEINIWPQGTPVTFIRLAGCNLRCYYCDTTKGQPADSGRDMTVEQVVAEVKKIGCPRIIITGGEPLTQQDDLLHLLNDLADYEISIETNGSYWVDSLLRGFADGWVLDIKLPSSGMANKMLSPEKYVNENFIIKFVCLDKNDFDAAVNWMDLIGSEPTFAFSPASPLSPAQLWGWMQAAKLDDAILSWQIHKQIWPDSDIER